MADKYQIEIECQTIQDHLLQLKKNRDDLQDQFSQLYVTNQQLWQQMQDDSLSCEGQLHSFEVEKQRLEKKLEELEIHLKEKNEKINELDLKASEYLLQVSTASNSLFDDDEDEDDDETAAARMASLIQQYDSGESGSGSSTPEDSSDEDTNTENIDYDYNIIALKSYRIADKQEEDECEIAELPDDDFATKAINDGPINLDAETNVGVSLCTEDIDIVKSHEITASLKDSDNIDIVKSHEITASLKDSDNIDIVKSHEITAAPLQNSVEEDGSVEVNKTEEGSNNKLELEDEHEGTQVESLLQLNNIITPSLDVKATIDQPDENVKTPIGTDEVKLEICPSIQTEDESDDEDLVIKTKEELTVDVITSDATKVGPMIHQDLSTIEKTSFKEDIVHEEKLDNISVNKSAVDIKEQELNVSNIVCGDIKEVKNQMKPSLKLPQNEVEENESNFFEVLLPDSPVVKEVKCKFVDHVDVDVAKDLLTNKYENAAVLLKGIKSVSQQSEEDVVSLSELVDELRRIKDDMGKCTNVKENSFTDLEDQISVTNSEVAKLRESIATMTNNLKEKDQNYQVLQEENVSKKQEFEIKITELQNVTNTCSMLNEEKDDLLLKMRGLENMMDEYRSEIENLDFDKPVITDDEEDDDDDSDDEESKSPDVLLLEEKMEKLEKDKTKLYNKLQCSKKRQKSLQQEREHKQQECEVLRKKVETVELKMRELQGTFDALVNAVLRERDELIEVVKNKSGEVDNLNGVVATMKEHSNKKQMEKVDETKVLDVEKLEKEKDCLKESLQVKTEQAEELERKVQSIQEEMSDFVAYLKDEMARLKEETDKTLKEKQGVEQVFASLQKEHEEVTKRNATLELSLKQVESNDKEKIDNFDCLKLQLDDLQQQLDELNNKNFSLTSELFTKDEEYKEELNAREATIQQLKITLTNNQKQSMENYHGLQDDNAVIQLKLEKDLEDSRNLATNLEVKLKNNEEEAEKEKDDLLRHLKTLEEENALLKSNVKSAELSKDLEAKNEEVKIEDEIVITSTAAQTDDIDTKLSDSLPRVTDTAVNNDTLLAQVHNLSKTIAEGAIKEAQLILNGVHNNKRLVNEPMQSVVNDEEVVQAVVDNSGDIQGEALLPDHVPEEAMAGNDVVNKKTSLGGNEDVDKEISLAGNEIANKETSLAGNEVANKETTCLTDDEKSKDVTNKCNLPSDKCDELTNLNEQRISQLESSVGNLELVLNDKCDYINELELKIKQNSVVITDSSEQRSTTDCVGVEELGEQIILLKEQLNKAQQQCLTLRETVCMLEKEKILLVEEKGEPIIEEKGEPIVEQKGEPIIEEKGEPIIEEKGEPIVESKSEDSVTSAEVNTVDGEKKKL